MRLHYYQGFGDIKNFGDELNLHVWESRFPGFFDETDEDIFLGIGTLINQKIPDSPRVIVMGAGVGYGDVPRREIIKNWEIFFVRGPLSTEKLSIAQTFAASDPAILLHREEVVPRELRRKCSQKSHEESDKTVPPKALNQAA